MNKIKHICKENIVKANTAGISFGLSQLVQWGTYGLLFWFGGWLMTKDEVFNLAALTVYDCVNARDCEPSVSK